LRRDVELPNQDKEDINQKAPTYVSAQLRNARLVAGDHLNSSSPAGGEACGLVQMLARSASRKKCAVKHR
jgi:hypothetical protein